MFSYHLPANVYAGEGALNVLPSLCADYRTAAFFTDRGVLGAHLTEGPIQALKDAGLAVHLIGDLPSEPTCDQAQSVLDACRRLQPDIIIAMGGGSVMDMAKLASVTPDCVAVRDLLDEPFKAKKILPTVMIPTTAGTGAEATPNAIVSVPEKEMKIGIVSLQMIPDSVILDGSTIRLLPPSIAAATGIDALCHAIECFTSNKATPFSDLFALEALKLIFPNIEKACLDRDAVDAKNAMLLAAFYGGAAIACSGTTAVHALSYPLGGKYRIAHGVSNAMLLLPVMRFNLEACLPEFARVYDALGETCCKTQKEKAVWLLKRMEDIVARLQIPTDLTSFGVSPQDLDGLVNAGLQVQRLLQNNRRPVTESDARNIYKQVLPNA